MSKPKPVGLAKPKTGSPDSPERTTDAGGGELPPEFDDELTDAQIEAMRALSSQDETKMGEVVRDFDWRKWA